MCVCPPQEELTFKTHNRIFSQRYTLVWETLSSCFNQLTFAGRSLMISLLWVHTFIVEVCIDFVTFWWYHSRTWKEKVSENFTSTDFTSPKIVSRTRTMKLWLELTWKVSKFEWAYITVNLRDTKCILY